jgi:hypothetical protein
MPIVVANIAPKTTPALHLHRNAHPLVLFVVHQLTRGRREPSLDPVVLHKLSVNGSEGSLRAWIHSDFLPPRPPRPPRPPLSPVIVVIVVV